VASGGCARLFRDDDSGGARQGEGLLERSKEGHSFCSPHGSRKEVARKGRPWVRRAQDRTDGRDNRGCACRDACDGDGTCLECRTCTLDAEGTLGRDGSRGTCEKHGVRDVGASGRSCRGPCAHNSRGGGRDASTGEWDKAVRE